MKTKSQYPTAQELEREKLLAGAEAQRKAAALADLGVIGELLEDRESPAGDLSRLVVRRMARLLAELHQPATSGSLARFDHELKGLRALHALLLDSQVLRQQADVIDLHGPRFKIVFDYIMASLKTAMQQVGIHPSQMLSVYVELRDQLSLGYDKLQCELAKANHGGENTGPRSAEIWPQP